MTVKTVTMVVVTNSQIVHVIRTHQTVLCLVHGGSVAAVDDDAAAAICAEFS